MRANTSASGVVGRPHSELAQGQLSKANTWRRDGTEFLMADVWTRFWSGREIAPAYPRASRSLEVTSRYAAILDERDTSLADALEEIYQSAPE